MQPKKFSFIHGKQKSQKHTQINTLKYNLKFTSIIAPGAVSNLRLIQFNDNRGSNPHNKLVVKQSYLLLTWLAYLKDKSIKSSKTNTPSFFVQPVRQFKLTHIKAPMAHKTFSQEQFLFKHYNLVISFKTILSQNYTLNSVNNSIFIALSLRSSIPFFNTNLLFLKRIKFSFISQDSTFMKFF
jgi:hypothetical protein